MSSLTNAALSVTVAHAVTASDFGRFSVAVVVYTFLIGVTRSTSSQVLAIRGNDDEEEIRRALGAAVLAATATGVVVLLAAAALSNSVLAVLALAMPCIVIQDAYRYTSITLGRPAISFTVTASQAIALAVGLAIVVGTKSSFPAVFVAGWGVAAACSGVFALGLLGFKPDLRGGFAYILTSRRISGYLAAEWTATVGSAQVALLVLAAVRPPDEIGALRGAQTLIGLLNIMSIGLANFAVPELARRTCTRRTLVLVACGVSGGLAAASLVLGVVLAELPDSVGVLLLGETWAGTSDVAPILAIWSAGAAAGLGPLIVMHARAEVSSTFSINLAVGSAVCVLPTLGAVVFGASGAAIGFALATTLTAPLWWIFLHRSLRTTADHDARDVRNVLASREGSGVDGHD